MYKYKKGSKSTIKSIAVYEGETIENKIERIVTNKEPITDGAPEIFTERKNGVIAAYNIRTDRWEIATDAMDAVQKSITAKREAKAQEGVIQMKTDKKEDKISEAKTIQGQGEAPKGATKTE